MIRAVIDTNVIISGTFWNGVPRQILKASNQGTFTLISSMALLNELERVLNYDKFAGFFAAWDESPAVIIRRYQQMIEVVESIHLPDDAVRDPKDVMVLEAALGGKATHLVSGDTDLLSLAETYESLHIVTPVRFLEILGETSSA